MELSFATEINITRYHLPIGTGPHCLLNYSLNLDTVRIVKHFCLRTTKYFSKTQILVSKKKVYKMWNCRRRFVFATNLDGTIRKISIQTPFHLEDHHRRHLELLENPGRVRIVAVAAKFVDYRREKDEDVVHQQCIARALFRLIVVDGKLGNHDPDGGDDRGESQHEPDEQEHLDAAFTEDPAGVACAAVEHFVRDRIDHEEADRGQDAADVVGKVPRLWMHGGRIDRNPPTGKEQE